MNEVTSGKNDQAFTGLLENAPIAGQEQTFDQMNSLSVLVQDSLSLSSVPSATSSRDDSWPRFLTGCVPEYGMLSRGH